MRINVQVAPGSSEFETIEQRVVENHPEASESGVCDVCEPLDNKVVDEVGYPPFHPNCVCTVEWKKV